MKISLELGFQSFEVEIAEESSLILPALHDYFSHIDPQKAQELYNKLFPRGRAPSPLDAGENQLANQQRVCTHYLELLEANKLHFNAIPITPETTLDSLRAALETEEEFPGSIQPLPLPELPYELWDKICSLIATDYHEIPFVLDQLYGVNHFFRNLLKSRPFFKNVFLNTVTDFMSLHHLNILANWEKPFSGIVHSPYFLNQVAKKLRLPVSEKYEYKGEMISLSGLIAHSPRLELDYLILNTPEADKNITVAEAQEQVQTKTLTNEALHTLLETINQKHLANKPPVLISSRIPGSIMGRLK